MIETLYTKEALVYHLMKGAILGDLLDLSDGQECTIFKADSFTTEDDVVIYIPDMEMNDIPYDRAMTANEIKEVQYLFYTGEDFLEICGGDREKAEMLFGDVDWQNPHSRYDEMLRDGDFNNPNYQPWHGITRWCADDVVGIAAESGIKMSSEEAEQWWNEHENEFRQAMVQYGNELLESMIR